MKIYKYKKLGYRAEVEVNGKTVFVAGFTEQEVRDKVSKMDILTVVPDLKPVMKNPLEKSQAIA